MVKINVDTEDIAGTLADMFADMFETPEPTPPQVVSTSVEAPPPPVEPPPVEPKPKLVVTPIYVPPPEPTPLQDDEPKSEHLKMFDCGHLNFALPEKNVEARAEGFCCMGGKQKHIVHWWALRGKYRRPLPVAVRYDPDKKGFQGYCCDDEGYYIGGNAGCCLYDRPEGTIPCPGHRKTLPKYRGVPVVETEPEEESEVEEAVSSGPVSTDKVEVTTPEPSRTSYKERQRLAKKTKRK